MGTRSLHGYLTAIHDREMSDGGATVSDVAGYLGVAPASASEMITRLVDRRLVKHERYGRAYLIEEGRDLAEELEGKYQVLRWFFTEILEVDRNIAERDAREVSGVIGNEAVARLARWARTPGEEVED